MKWIAGTIITVATVILMLAAADLIPRFLSWRSLSAETVEQKTQLYLDTRTFSPEKVIAVCVYAVECSSGRAILKKMQQPERFDFQELRQTIWSRRFEKTCPGRTANLGLHIVRSSQDSIYNSSDHAIWSFYNDRFIPRLGRFSGGSFSEEPWDRCTVETATYSIQDGKMRTPLKRSLSEQK